MEIIISSNTSKPIYEQITSQIEKQPVNQADHFSLFFVNFWQAIRTSFISKKTFIG